MDQVEESVSALLLSLEEVVADERVAVGQQLGTCCDGRVEL